MKYKFIYLLIFNSDDGSILGVEITILTLAIIPFIVSILICFVSVHPDQDNVTSSETILPLVFSDYYLFTEEQNLIVTAILSIIKKRANNFVRTLNATDINSLCYASVTRIKPNPLEKITIDNIREINLKRKRTKLLLNKFLSSDENDEKKRNQLQQRVTSISVSELFALVSYATVVSKSNNKSLSDLEYLSREIAKVVVKKRAAFSQRISSFFLSFRNRKVPENTHWNNNNNIITVGKKSGVSKLIPADGKGKRTLMPADNKRRNNNKNYNHYNKDEKDDDGEDDGDFFSRKSSLFDNSNRMSREDSTDAKPILRVMSEKSPMRRKNTGLRMQVSQLSKGETIHDRGPPPRNIDITENDNKDNEVKQERRNYLTEKFNFYGRHYFYPSKLTKPKNKHRRTEHESNNERKSNRYVNNNNNNNSILSIEIPTEDENKIP